MSKHISRLISSSLYTVRTTPRHHINSNIRFQTTRPSGDPSKGKGPITWKNLSLVAVAGAGAMGFFYYVKNEKDVGKNVKSLSLDPIMKVYRHSSNNERTQTNAWQGSYWRSMGTS